MRADLASQKGFGDLFEKEAAVSARLNHAGIVQVFDFGAIDGRPFISMEYVEGADLASLLDTSPNQRLPVSVVSEIGQQVCRALAHAHHRQDLRGQPIGIIHGDISPSNILLSCDGQAKLTDFGLARLRSATGSNKQIAGKYSYMSPEQASGEETSASSDLFSLGLVLYEMFTGQRAYPLCDPPVDTLRDILAGNHRSAMAVDPALAGPIDQFLTKALMRSASDRFASAVEMGQALGRACPPCGPEPLAGRIRDFLHQTRGEACLSPEPTMPAISPVYDPEATATVNTGRRPLWVLLVLLVLFWGAGFGWWWLHSAPVTQPPLRTLPVRPTIAPVSPKEAKPAPAQAIRYPQAPSAPQPNRPKHVVRPAGPTKPAIAVPPANGTAPKTDAHTGWTVASDSPPPSTIQPPPAGLELTVDPAYETVMDHRRTDSRTLHIGDRRPHLVQLRPVDKGMPVVNLRLEPGSDGASWRLTASARPWLYISLDGKPSGQTPRSRISLPTGTSVVQLHRNDWHIRVGLTTRPPPTDGKTP
jgi:hypothetical protein